MTEIENRLIERARRIARSDETRLIASTLEDLASLLETRLTIASADDGPQMAYAQGEDSMEWRQKCQREFQCWMAELDLPKRILDIAVQCPVEFIMGREVGTFAEWLADDKARPVSNPRIWARLLLGYEAPSRDVTVLARRLSWW
jgi:hypothetical protein